MSSENSNSEKTLIQLSIIVIRHDCPNHFITITKLAKAITQLMPKMIRNLVCDKGDDAIK
jgi:hypothetical protein